MRLLYTAFEFILEGFIQTCISAGLWSLVFLGRLMLMMVEHVRTNQG